MLICPLSDNAKYSLFQFLPKTFSGFADIKKHAYYQPEQAKVYLNFSS